METQAGMEMKTLSVKVLEMLVLVDLLTRNAVVAETLDVVVEENLVAVAEGLRRVVETRNVVGAGNQMVVVL